MFYLKTDNNIYNDTNIQFLKMCVGYSDEERKFLDVSAGFPFNGSVDRMR